MSTSSHKETGDHATAQRWHWLMPLLVAGGFVAGGLAFAETLPLLLAGLCIGLGGLAILRWPDLATLSVIGLIYSNLPVVAVQIHNAPGILPAAVLAMLAWPLFYRVLIRRESICFYAAFPYVLAYLVIMFVGTLWSREPSKAWEHLISFLLEGMALYLIVTNVVRTQRTLHATLWVLALCGMLMGGAPLLQQATGNVQSNFGGLAQADSEFASGEGAVEGVIRQHRAAGTIGEQNRYAQFMLMLVPIGLALVTIESRWQWRAAAVGATLLALLGAAMAFSRGAAVGCVMAVCIAAWLKLIDRKQLKLVVFAGLLALALLPQYLTRLASLGSIAASTFTGQAGNHEDGAVRGRLTEMGAAAMVFRDHMLFGVGPGMFTSYSQEYGQIIGLRSLDEGRESHSLPLGIAAENGLLGLLAFTGLLGVVGLRLLRARQYALDHENPLGVQIATALLLVGILYITTGLFLHMAYIRYFWLLLAIADAAGHIIVHGDQGSDQLPGRSRSCCSGAC